MVRFVLFAALTCVAAPVHAQRIEQVDYAAVLGAIESYINHQPSHLVGTLLLFECTRNAKFHSGYERPNISVDLGEYPYVMREHKDTDRYDYVADVALDSKEMNVIIDMRIRGKWYGFMSKVGDDHGLIKILDIPPLLYEND